MAQKAQQAHATGGDQRGRAAGLRIEVYNFEVTSRGLKRVKVIRGF